MDFFIEPAENPVEKVSEMNIDELELSVRAFNRLKRGGINTVEDLINMTLEDLMGIKNLRRKELREILSKLKEVGLSLKSFKETDDIQQVMEEIVSEHGVQILQDNELSSLLLTRLLPGRLQNITRILLDDGIGQWFTNMSDDDSSYNYKTEKYFCEKLYDEWAINPEAVTPIIQKIQAGVTAGMKNRSEQFGRKICNSLKAMRRAFAEANGIEYEEKDCTNPKPCNGTCPYCEERNQYLLKAAKRLSQVKDILYPEFTITPISGPNEE